MTLLPPPPYILEDFAATSMEEYLNPLEVVGFFGLIKCCYLSMASACIIRRYCCCNCCCCKTSSMCCCCWCLSCYSIYRCLVLSASSCRSFMSLTSCSSWISSCIFSFFSFFCSRFRSRRSFRLSLGERIEESIICCCSLASRNCELLPWFSLSSSPSSSYRQSSADWL